MFHIFTLKYTNMTALDFFLPLLVTHDLVPLCFHSNLHWQMQGEGLRGPVPSLLCGGKKTEPSQQGQEPTKTAQNSLTYDVNSGKEPETHGVGYHYAIPAPLTL